MFDQFQSVVKPSTNYVNIDLMQTVVLTDEELCSRLDSDLTDEQLYQLVKNYYSRMLDDIFEKKETRQASYFTKYFTQPKFII